MPTLSMPAAPEGAGLPESSVAVAWCVPVPVAVWLPVGTAVVAQDVTLLVSTMVVSEVDTIGTETVTLGAEVSVRTPAGDVVTIVMEVTGAGPTGMQAPLLQAN